MRSRTPDILSLVARLAIGGVLLTSGFSKALMSQAKLIAMLDAYHLFSLDHLKILAATLPWLELYIGLFVLAGLHLKWVSRISSGLFLSFVAFLSWVLYKQIRIDDCGCFGSLLHFTPQQTIVMDSVLLVFSVFLVWYSRTHRTSWLSLDTWCAFQPSKSSK